MTEVHCVLDSRSSIGESPVWDADSRKLYFVDIEAGILHRFDPCTSKAVSWRYNAPIGCVALRAGPGLVAAMGSGFFHLDPERDFLEAICEPEKSMPDNRFNDGTVDPAGRFWAGSMRRHSAGPAPQGSLYRLDADHGWARVMSEFWTINGLAFSPDGRRMYLSDSHPSVRTIWVCDYDPDDGVPRNRRLFTRTGHLAGRPDGGAVDADGCYWMAGVGGGQLVRFTPSAKVDRIVDMPVAMPTKIAFGGSHMDVMYVTSILGDDPQSGGLFAVHAGVTGVPVPRFAG
jgi:sugar lactone lactonase YvrE